MKQIKIDIINYMFYKRFCGKIHYKIEYSYGKEFDKFILKIDNKERSVIIDRPIMGFNSETDCLYLIEVLKYVLKDKYTKEYNKSKKEMYEKSTSILYSGIFDKVGLKNCKN